MPNGKTGFRVPTAQRPAEGKYPFTMIVAGQTATGALANPAVTSNGPQGDAAGVGQSATQNIKLGDNAKARLMFGGVGTADQTIDYQVILWRVGVEKRDGSRTIYIPDIVAQGTVILGALARPALGGVVAGLFADQIDDDVSRSGTIVNTKANDMVGMLEVLCKGATWLSVETNIVNATSADVFVALGD